MEKKTLNIKLSDAGFTMLEMLVTLALLSFFLIVAIPNMASLSTTFNRANSRAWLIQDIKRAQAHTVTEGCRGILKINADGKSYWYGCDYLAYNTDADPVGDSVSFTRNLPDKITVAASGPVIFNSRGQTVDVFGIVSSATLTLTDSGDAFASGLLNGTGVFSYY